MPWKYNPFTDALDQTGSGGGTSYIDGDVEYHSNLPVTAGTPAVNSAFLVRKGEGLYFVSRKPAGIWVRELNNGNLDDWKYAGTFSDLYRDANFRILNNTDITKELAFDVSGLATGTTSTLTVPASGTIARTSDFAAPPSIGSTTRNTGAFTTLSSNVGTITASTPLAVTQTWNNSATNFRAIETNITNTASQNESYHLACNVGGSLVAYIRRDGRIVAGANVYGSTGLESALLPQGVAVGNTSYIGFCSNSFANDSGGDLRLFRDAANTLGQRNGTNPQTFRLYNTFTDASNHERLSLRWASNVAIIGTEKAGTGSARQLDFVTDGIVRCGISTGGNLGVANQIFFGSVSPNTALVRLFQSGDGILSVTDGAQISFNRLQFGGTTSAYPALKRSSTALQVRLADDSAFAPFECAGLTLNGNLTASTRNIVTDTTTGTRIGTGTTQLLGFWNAAPSAQPAAVADATDAASTQARLNDLLARLRTIGIIAT